MMLSSGWWGPVDLLSPLLAFRKKISASQKEKNEQQE